MKAIVTGGNGFIGSHIVDRLIQKSWEVIVIDDNSAECNDKFYYNNKAKNYKINICDYDLIYPLFEGVDVVFHLAAESRIQPAILNPCYTTKVNVVGTCNILQAARESDVDRVIYSSTSSGYGRKNKPPLREDMLKDCLNPYSVAKCAGEDLCSMYTSLFGLKTVSFRYFNVYGERQPTRGQYAPVVGLFLKQYAEGKPMTIVGDGTQRRDFTNIYDAVEANILAAETGNQSVFGQVFNVGTGTNFSILDIVNKIDGECENIAPRIGESKVTLADNSKIKNILGWKPKIEFMNWLQEELKKEKYKK
jgi:UDP-glucose 4-epimerase|tara:strand:- start:1026 stop:1943 length:918 start_codon:yes stop_codon:yes gene_type:complete